jgi:hypothetical protein
VENISQVATASVATSQAAYAGRLIVNADDWGRDRQITDRTLDCIRAGSISGVSAMVFMDDSERGAEIAREHRVDAGLHLNFTEPFSSKKCPPKLLEQREKVGTFLRRHAAARIFYHPGLTNAFTYVVEAQLEEYERLYGEQAKRIDGHHHQHLCANVLSQNLLPSGALVRRNFSFEPGERSWINRFYRKLVDRRLARTHKLADCLFSIQPLSDRSRLRQILSLARFSLVELETHPGVPEEHFFLTSPEFFHLLGDMQVSPDFTATVAGVRQS